MSEFGRDRREVLFGGDDAEFASEAAAVPLVGGVLGGPFGQQEVGPERFGESTGALVTLAVDDVGEHVGAPGVEVDERVGRRDVLPEAGGHALGDAPVAVAGQIRFMLGLTLSNCSGVVYETRSNVSGFATGTAITVPDSDSRDSRSWNRRNTSVPLISRPCWAACTYSVGPDSSPR